METAAAAPIVLWYEPDSFEAIAHLILQHETRHISCALIERYNGEKLH
jgi:hypothetical protein